MRARVFICFTVAIALALMSSGCGGIATSNFRGISDSSVTTTVGGTSTTTSNPPAISITPDHATLSATQSVKFAVTVTNAASTAVNWTISECTTNCGTLTQDGTYTAPALIGKGAYFQVRAVLVSNPTYYAAASVYLQPIMISISPTLPMRLAAGATRSFEALVRFDPANQGVSWSLAGPGCTGAACGWLSDTTATSAVYHAPATAPNPSLVAVKATSLSDGNQTQIAPMVLFSLTAQSPLVGKYAFLMHGMRIVADYNEGSDAAIAGHLEIASDGTVAGVWDATLTHSGGVTEPIQGNYTADSDGNGTLTLTAGGAIWKFRVSGVGSGGDSAIMSQDAYSETSTVRIDSGYLLRQDTNALNVASVQGNRVAALTFSNTGALARWTANSSGALTNGVMDLTWEGKSSNFFTTTPITGSFTAPDPLTGRGTLALTALAGPDYPGEVFHFAYYVVSAERMLLVEVDPNTWQLPLMRGEARLQKSAGEFSNASLAGAAVFSLASPDAGMWWTPMAILGRLDADGAGSLRQTYDGNQQNADDWPTVTLAASGSGSYSVEATGRVPMDIPETPTNNYFPHTAVAYLLDANTGYLMREAVFGTPFGYFEPQTSAPFSAAAMAGSYQVTIAGPPRTFIAPADAGAITLGNDGSAAAFLAIDRGLGPEMIAWTGTYTVDANGRGVMTLTDMNSGKGKSIVFWAVSPNKAIAILSTTADEAYPILVQMQR